MIWQNRTNSGVPYVEPFDQFPTELRIKVSSCNFREENLMIRDKIVFSCSGPKKILLLRDDETNKNLSIL